VRVSPVVVSDAVSFAYGPTQVLDGVSFEIGAGELVALTGPNGSGKTTLMRVLLGLMAPTGGTVRVPDGRRTGYVPQRPVLAAQFPAVVDDVVAAGRVTGRRWWRRSAGDDRAAVDDALDAVGLRGLRRRRMDELSGGQQQRAFIAKALAGRPELLVLDEPTTGVDAASQQRFRDALVATRDRGGAVLLVSHELGAVADDLDRVLLLRQGKIDFDGPPADLTAAGVSLGVHAHDLPVWLEGL
jgi:zinc transport system ATP-binding protein